jgi:hypothetical protein
VSSATIDELVLVARVVLLTLRVPREVFSAVAAPDVLKVVDPLITALVSVGAEMLNPLANFALVTLPSEGIISSTWTVFVGDTTTAFAPLANGEVNVI